MTDASLDPQDDRLDDVDTPRDAHEDVDELVVNLDTQEQDEGEQSADDKYIQVVDGRPETLGVEEQDAPRDEA